jgi:DNA mismatch endonuclease (patch repair protein)
VDGCFWHGCEKHFKLPKSNRSFWKKKINSNIKRDVEVNRFLRGKGWKVIRLWEHDVKKPGKVLSRIKRNLLKP